MEGANGSWKATIPLQNMLNPFRNLYALAGYGSTCIALLVTRFLPQLGGDLNNRHRDLPAGW